MRSTVRAAIQADVPAIAQVHVNAWKSTYQFYATLGGQRLEEKEIVLAGKSLKEVAYGWLNTGSLRQ